MRKYFKSVFFYIEMAASCTLCLLKINIFFIILYFLICEPICKKCNVAMKI